LRVPLKSSMSVSYLCFTVEPVCLFAQGKSRELRHSSRGQWRITRGDGGLAAIPGVPSSGPRAALQCAALVSLGWPYSPMGTTHPATARVPVTVSDRYLLLPGPFCASKPAGVGETPGVSVSYYWPSAARPLAQSQGKNMSIARKLPSRRQHQKPCTFSVAACRHRVALLVSAGTGVGSSQGNHPRRSRCARRPLGPAPPPLPTLTCQRPRGTRRAGKL
jgi:hypothetical protein